MEEKICGIVVGAVSYGESDKILTIYTPEKGLVSAGIKGVKKAGAKLKFASEPFCFAEFITSVSPKRRTVTGASLIDSFYPLREDIKKFYAGATAIDYVKRFCRYESTAGEIFTLLIDCLKTLAYGNENPLSVVASFLIDALAFSGYGLNLNACLYCGKDIEGRVFFNPNDGGFYCEECFNGFGREIREETYKSIKAIKNNESQQADCLPVLKLLDYYLENKTDLPLNTLKELIKL